MDLSSPGIDVKLKEKKERPSRSWSANFPSESQPKKMLAYIYIYVCVCVCVCVNFFDINSVNKKVNRKAHVYIGFLYINFQVSCVIVGTCC
jgi:hypothetical protein